LRFSIKRAEIQVGRRYRQLRDLLQSEGPRGITDRVRTVTAQWLAPKNVILPVCRADVLAADLSRPFRPEVPSLKPGQNVTVNWVIIPTGPRSGGSTTIFRMIRYLEAHGYTNRIYLYNVYGAEHRY
jgi:hypothetical protein